MSFELEAVLFGVLVPAGTAAMILFLARGLPERAVVAAGALAFGAAFALGYVLLALEPLKPEVARHWIPPVALLASLVGAIEGLLKLPWWARLPGRIAVAALAAWLIIPDWPKLAPTRHLWQMVLGASVFATWTALDRMADRRPRVLMLLLMGLILIGAGVVLERAGIMKLVQVIGLAGGALIGFLLVLGRRPGHELLRGAVPGLTALLCGTIITGRLAHFSEVPAFWFYLILVLPLLVPLSLLISRPPPE